MAEEPTYDWSTAPGPMREAFEKMQADTKALQAKAEADGKRLAKVDRRERFNELKMAGGDALKDVSLEDIGDMAADQMTPTILQAKALEKGQARAAAEAEMAKALGFTDADELRAFRVEVETRKNAQLAAMGKTAAAATTGQNVQDPIATPQEAAYAAFNEARTAGLPSDDAKAAAVSALLAGAAAQQAK